MNCRGEGSVAKMEIKVEKYTLHVTQNELDLIYAALCHFPSDHPRCGEVFLLKEKFRQYQSTVLANGERESNDT